MSSLFQMSKWKLIEVTLPVPKEGLSSSDGPSLAFTVKAIAGHWGHSG